MLSDRHQLMADCRRCGRVEPRLTARAGKEGEAEHRCPRCNWSVQNMVLHRLGWKR